MGLLSKHKEETKNQEIGGQESDTLGGGVLDSNAYKFNIELAYKHVANSGAEAIIIKANGEPLEGGSKVNFSTTQYITGRNGKPYWERDGKKNFLKGYNNVIALAEVTNSGDLDTEERVIPIYDFEKRKEVPTQAEVVVELIGKSFIGGVLKRTVDKNVKDNQGNYVPSGDTREENELDKIFNEDGLTITELNAGLDEPQFLNRWLDKNKGTNVNKAKGAKQGGAVSTKQPLAAATKSSGLFEE